MRHRRAVLLLLLTASHGAAAESPHGAVVAPHPMAAAAAEEMLHAGGSAADAAIAAQAMLAVVAPQGAGLGGGAMALNFDAATRETSAWDGREAAPAGVTPELFAHDAAPPSGGRGVGVPGTLRMLEALHRERGRLPWADLLAPAIRAAEAGAPVSKTLAAAIDARSDALRRQPASLALFFDPAGAPLAAGAMLANPALAQTLRQVASGGAGALMHGTIAADIATTARGDEQPGLLTTDDLAAYAAHRRTPPCVPYRGRTVCAVGGPGAGTQVLETLALLARFDLAPLDPIGAQAAELLAEAERLAMADRARFLADPDFAAPPALLDPDYIRARSQLIDPDHAAATVEAGEPGRDAPPTGPMQPDFGDDAIVVVDAAGNAVCLTSSGGPPFGSGLVVRGMALNAALADFARQPAVDGRKLANRLQPGKRPATSMTAVFVLSANGQLEAVVGGGGPNQLAQAVTGLVDWGLLPAAALALPHVSGAAGAVVVQLLPELAAADPAKD